MLGTGIDAVLHFAAKSLVAESVAYPDRYWDNNLGGTLALLEAMRVAGTRKIVFSSTAAVYGEPERIPITETDPVRPTSPYGESKVAVDTALTEYARMHQIGAVSLRYFNVAGAYEDASGTWRGERHHPETHLIPTVLPPRAAARGSSFSATTTRPRTGPASGTTSTCRTWRARTCWPWTPRRPAGTRSTTWAAGPVTPTARCSTRAARSPG